MSYDKTTVIGNVGSVQPINTVGETSVLNFTMASNKKYGEKETVTWFRVAVWGKYAQALAPYIEVGKQVFVEGSLQPDPETGSPRTYQTESGDTRASYEVRADTIRLLGGKEKAQQEEKSNIPF